MSAAAQRLAELGLSLPPVAKPVAAYVPALRVGNQVLTSGQIPLVDGNLAITGKAGAEVSLDQAYAQARICALNALAAAASAAGGLERIERIVKVVVYVASAPDFTEQPKVANGASDLFRDLFGERGQHVRSAVGVAVLPLDVPVELELIVEVN